MKKWIPTFAALAFAAILVQAAQASIYVADSSGKLGIVDPVTHSATVVAQMKYGIYNWPLTDIAIDASGQVWGVDSYYLYQVDKTDGALTRIGSLGSTPAYGSNALTFGPDGTLYLASTKSTNLFKVNLSDGSATSIGGTGLYSAGDLAFYSGQLYWTAVSQPDHGAIDANDLVQVSLSSGAVSGVVNLGTTGHTSLFGLAVDDGSLYAVSGVNPEIYRFIAPTSNGSVTAGDSYGGQGLGPAFGASEVVVPEPATLLIWCLLGAVAVTASWWRKRKLA